MVFTILLFLVFHFNLFFSDHTRTSQTYNNEQLAQQQSTHLENHQQLHQLKCTQSFQPVPRSTVIHVPPTGRAIFTVYCSQSLPCMALYNFIASPHFIRPKKD
jgi:hypothetical protein